MRALLGAPTRHQHRTKDQFYTATDDDSTRGIRERLANIRNKPAQASLFSHANSASPNSRAYFPNSAAANTGSFSAARRCASSSPASSSAGVSSNTGEALHGAEAGSSWGVSVAGITALFLLLLFFCFFTRATDAWSTVNCMGCGCVQRYYMFVLSPLFHPSKCMLVSWPSVGACRCTLRLWLWQMNAPRSAARTALSSARSPRRSCRSP